jgi:hypothetical protein
MAEIYLKKVKHYVYCESVNHEECHFLDLSSRLFKCKAKKFKNGYLVDICNKENIIFKKILKPIKSIKQLPRPHEK